MLLFRSHIFRCGQILTSLLRHCCVDIESSCKIPIFSKDRLCISSEVACCTYTAALDALALGIRFDGGAIVRILLLSLEERARTSGMNVNRLCVWLCMTGILSVLLVVPFDSYRGLADGKHYSY